MKRVKWLRPKDKHAGGLLSFPGGKVDEGNDIALFEALVVHNPDVSVAKIIQMFGLKKLLESLSIPELKIMLNNIVHAL